MLKLLLIIVITMYILSKIGRFLFGMGTYASQQNKNYNRPPGGNVNVDGSTSKKNKSPIKGGEYIDFEEVK